MKRECPNGCQVPDQIIASYQYCPNCGSSFQEKLEPQSSLVYVSAGRDELKELGEAYGLSGSQLSVFVNSVNRIPLAIEIDLRSGKVKVTGLGHSDELVPLAGPYIL